MHNEELNRTRLSSAPPIGLTVIECNKRAMSHCRRGATGAFVILYLFSSHLLAQKSDAGTLHRYFQDGERALAEKRYAEAEKSYEKLRQLDPGIAEVHAKLGLIYFQDGKFTQAVPALRQALKLKPNPPN